MEQKKAVRSLKVYGQGGYGQNGTPMIMLKGNWLQQLGFEIGDYISVICENGKLVISLDEQRLEWETQQKELLAREKKEFQKRLKEKQEKLYEQFVAESCTRYGV